MLLHLKRGEGEILVIKIKKPHSCLKNGVLNIFIIPPIVKGYQQETGKTYKYISLSVQFSEISRYFTY